MSKRWTPRKTTVELDSTARPSRIRRDPPPPAERADADGKAQWRSSEWEIRLAIIGIVLFALAINIITVAISAYTN